MNVSKFTDGEPKELDQVIKRELRYLIREDGGRGIKSMRNISKEATLRVTYSLLAKQVNQSCMEKREHQGGEFNSRRSNKDNRGC